MIPEDNLILSILQLIGAGSIFILVVYTFFWIYKHPRIFEKWVKLTKGQRQRLQYFVKHTLRAWDYKKTMGPSLNAVNKEMDWKLPKKITISFVDPEKHGKDFVKGEIEDGTIKIIKAWES